MAELLFRPTQARRGAAGAQKIRVAHFAETGSHFFELEWLESYGAHVRYLFGCWN
jgi:hypothetical protein